MAKGQNSNAVFYADEIRNVFQELIKNIHVELDVKLELSDTIEQDVKTISRLSNERNALNRAMNVFEVVIQEKIGGKQDE